MGSEKRRNIIRNKASIKRRKKIEENKHQKEEKNQISNTGCLNI